jgi:hypothetical protein
MKNRTCGTGTHLEISAARLAFGVDKRASGEWGLKVRLLLRRTRRRLGGRRFFEFLLGCILFRWRIHKPIKTTKTLILFLHKATILNCLGWSGNLFRCWLYLIIIAIQAFLGLIFNVKTGPQCLYRNLRHRKSRKTHSNEQNIPCLHRVLQFEIVFNGTGSLPNCRYTPKLENENAKKRPLLCAQLAEALGIKNQHRVLLRIVGSRSICGELKARLSENVTASIPKTKRSGFCPGRFRGALFTGEAGVLVPATAAVLPGLGLWPSAHPFGRRGAPAFR